MTRAMQSVFEILGLAPSFSLDMKALETAYFTAQRACHPDRFVGRGQADRLAAITRSQQVNDAYEILKNPLTRAEHLLLLKGIDALSDEAKAPPEVLMEMMELRERVMDAGADGRALAAIIEEIRALARANEQALATAFASGDDAGATRETLRLQYLGKAMEEAHMLVYRLKAAHA